MSAAGLASLPVGEHPDGNGLALRVSRSGARTWTFRYRPKLGRGRGPQRRLTLGALGGPLALDVGALPLDGFRPPDALGLTEAREAARVLIGLAARGVDPLAVLEETDRRRQMAGALGTTTFSALLDRFFEARTAELRPATVKLWQSLTRTELRPRLGDRAPENITRADVKELHAAIGESGRRTWANRAVELINAVFSWAVDQEILSGSPVVRVKRFRETPRSRVLRHEEIGRIFVALEGEPYGDAVRLLFLTGARVSEVAGMTWAEVDLLARTWRIPPERSKTWQARPVPLSSWAMEILLGRREANPPGRWVFPSRVASVGPVSSLQSTFRRLVQRSGVIGWRLHDVRRTVRTELQALAIRSDVAEFVLGHVRHGVESTYNRYEPLAEAAEALQVWADRLRTIIGEGT